MLRRRRVEETRMNIRTLLGRCAAACTLSLIFSANSPAADDPATPAPPTETERLTNDVERLKAEQARFEAKFGTLADDLAPKGDITATNLSVEGEILAYSTVDTLASKIAETVKSAGDATTIALFSEAELKLMSEWRAVGAQVKLLEDKPVADATPQIPGSCPKAGQDLAPLGAPIAAIANVAVQAFSLFRVDRTITGTKVELNEFAVNAQIANQLIGKGLKVVYLPSVYDLTASGAFTDIEIYKRLAALKDQVADDIGKIEAARGKFKDCKKLAEWLEDSGAFLERRKQLLAVVNGIIDEITKPDDAGLSRIQAYQRASQMSKLTANAWLLQTNPISAAGNVVTTKNIFRTKLRFGGGSVLSYMLFKPDGALAKAGTVAAYKGAQKMSEVPSLVGTP
jgi:hypothetical protein